MQASEASSEPVERELTDEEVNEAQWREAEEEYKKKITFMQLMEMSFRKASVQVKAVALAKGQGGGNSVVDCLCDWS